MDLKVAGVCPRGRVPHRGLSFPFPYVTAVLPSAPAVSEHLAPRRYLLPEAEQRGPDFYVYAWCTAHTSSISSSPFPPRAGFSVVIVPPAFLWANDP